MKILEILKILKNENLKNYVDFFRISQNKIKIFLIFMSEAVMFCGPSVRPIVRKIATRNEMSQCHRPYENGQHFGGRSRQVALSPSITAKLTQRDV